MTTYTDPRHGAMALGALCSIGAAGVLLEDIRHTQTITLDHGLSVIVLICAIATGVMTWQAIAERSFSAILLAPVAVLSTTYCIMTTAGRSAESQAVKFAAAESINKARAGLEKKKAEAEEMLSFQRQKLAAECATGAGKKCDGIRRALEIYEAAVKGNEADLAKLPLEQPVNAKAKNIASIVAPITGKDAGKIEAFVALIDPNIPALVLELGSILGWHLWFAARIQRRRAMTAANDQAGRPSEVELEQFRREFTSELPDPKPTGPKPGRRSKPEQRRSEVTDFVSAYRARNGRDPEQHEVRRALNLPRSTTCRYYNEAIAS